MKFNDLDKKKQIEIRYAIDSATDILGMDEWDGLGQAKYGSTLEGMVGLCATCSHLEYCESEYGNVHAKCYEYDLRLSGAQRIVECTKYDKRGQLSLNQMYGMAYLIEVDKSKIDGFIKSE